MKQELLQIKNLETAFIKKRSTVSAVNGVNLTIHKGEIVGIVGESGSGKTMTALSVMRLLPRNGMITRGEILFEGRELSRLSTRQMNTIRGKAVSMIFQDPMVALDPVYKCGDQIMEALCLHKGCSKKQAREESFKLLDQMGIPHPERYIEAYPHELSGGMCQRVMIAIALSCNPKLLIADEPTTALDVTVQAKILALLKDTQQKRDMGIMLITHDLGIVAEIADRVAVMYMGEIVELGDNASVFCNPVHPYTKGLMLSIPRLDQNVKRLYSIEGTIPSFGTKFAGCRFCTRCRCADTRCNAEKPPDIAVGEGHFVKCWLAKEEGAVKHG